MKTSLLLPIAAATLAAAPSLAQRALTPGQTTGGSLSTSDRAMNGSYYDEFTFHARRGETVVVRMESEELDTYLYLYHDEGGLREVARDDDGGDGTDSRLRHTVREDGTYVIRATSARRDTGPYMIALESSGRSGDWDDRDRGDRWGRRGDRGRLEANRPVRDYLSGSDPQLDNGARFHLYRYWGRRGERVSIRLSSDDFDSYLVLGLAGGRHGVGRVLERDDDSGGDLDAHLRYTLPHDGEYVIRVNPVGGGTGRYRLELRSNVRDRGRDDRDDRGYDESRVDGRLFGRWELYESTGRDRRGAPTGILSVRTNGVYSWRNQGRLRQGRLIPFTPRDGDRRGRYFLLDDGPEQVYVHFVRDGGAGYIRLVRRATGRVVATGYRDLTRSDVRLEADDEVIIEPEEN